MAKYALETSPFSVTQEVFCFFYLPALFLMATRGCFQPRMSHHFSLSVTHTRLRRMRGCAWCVFSSPRSAELAQRTAHFRRINSFTTQLSTPRVQTPRCTTGVYIHLAMAGEDNVYTNWHRMKQRGCCENGCLDKQLNAVKLPRGGVGWVSHVSISSWGFYNRFWTHSVENLLLHMANE